MGGNFRNYTIRCQMSKSINVIFTMFIFAKMRPTTRTVVKHTHTHTNTHTQTHTHTHNEQAHGYRRNLAALSKQNKTSAIEGHHLTNATLMYYV